VQDAVPGVMDISGETEETLALYGINADPTDGFGRQCLRARRFAEAGVRFIELVHGSWDQHSNIQSALAKNCAETDKPIAGLLADLQRRDLLKDTLILWGRLWSPSGGTPAFGFRRRWLRSHGTTLHGIPAASPCDRRKRRVMKGMQSESYQSAPSFGLFSPRHASTLRKEPNGSSRMQ
jgi:hypothetical protein